MISFEDFGAKNDLNVCRLKTVIYTADQRNKSHMSDTGVPAYLVQYPLTVNDNGETVRQQLIYERVLFANQPISRSISIEQDQVRIKHSDF